jgi:hypothetical protein
MTKSMCASEKDPIMCHFIKTLLILIQIAVLFARSAGAKELLW